MTELGGFRSVEAMLEATPNLITYKGDFGQHNRNIYPTDLDGIIEIKGHILVHEYKKVSAGRNKGQEILFESLRKNGAATILIYHIGPCWEMNLDRAIFSTPNNMPLNKDGDTTVTKEVNVLDSIHRFHIWWTRQILARANQ